jgi:nicotinate-nucleotide adenylyltransferase
MSEAGQHHGGVSDLQRPLGIFGGTFDPVHYGHLRLAEEARDLLGLSQVCWVPAGQPPLRSQPDTPAAHRVAMVAGAIESNPNFVLDTGEADSKETSYTVRTLERLRLAHGPERSLVLLLGADAFARLTSWHRWRDLFALAHIGVATRPGHPHPLDADIRVGVTGGNPCGTGIDVASGQAALDTQVPAELIKETAARRGTVADLATTPAGRIVPFTIRPLDISATILRVHLTAGESARYLAPDSVLDYIERHHLYRPLSS